MLNKGSFGGQQGTHVHYSGLLVALGKIKYFCKAPLLKNKALYLDPAQCITIEEGKNLNSWVVSIAYLPGLDFISLGVQSAGCFSAEATYSL